MSRSVAIRRCPSQHFQNFLTNTHCYSDTNRCIFLKDHRQRIPRFVTRRYLEKSIQKKLFCHLQLLQIKTIFREKKVIT